MTKVTSKDLEIARELYELSGLHGPSTKPGSYYIDKMAEVIARVRAAERHKGARLAVLR